MNKFTRSLTMLLVLLAEKLLLATPSTVYWSPCTPYLQPFKLAHITYDIYTRNSNMLPVTLGFTIGVLPFEEFGMEVGYDGYMPLVPTSAAHQFNAKIGLYEGKLLPIGVSVGFFGIGFEKNVSDLNAFHIAVGKTTPIGSLSIGYYIGNKNVLGDSNLGIMVGWLSPDIPSPIPGIKKFILASDYMAGDNSLGAFGVGLYTYFSDTVDLLTGPVFPISDKFTGGKDFLWTVQLDIDFSL